MLVVSLQGGGALHRLVSRIGLVLLLSRQDVSSTHRVGSCLQRVVLKEHIAAWDGHLAGCTD